MLALDGQIEARCTIDSAWELFCRFGDVAKLIPSVEHVEVDGDTVYGKVGVHLGKLFVSSRITMQVTERKPLACLKAEGVSYLGETIRTQVAKKDVGIDKESVGQLRIHLELGPGAQPECTMVRYHAEVEAEGRLRRIYESIIKNKAPAMMEEFAANIKRTLEGTLEGRLADAAPAGVPAPALAVLPAPSLSFVVAKRPSWLARLLGWLRDLVSSLRASLRGGDQR